LPSSVKASDVRARLTRDNKVYRVVRTNASGGFVRLFRRTTMPKISSPPPRAALGFTGVKGRMPAARAARPTFYPSHVRGRMFGTSLDGHWA